MWTWLIDTFTDWPLELKNSKRFYYLRTFWIGNYLLTTNAECKYGHVLYAVNFMVIAELLPK